MDKLYINWCCCRISEPSTVFRELVIINLPGLIIAVAAGCLAGEEWEPGQGCRQHGNE